VSIIWSILTRRSLRNTVAPAESNDADKAEAQAVHVEDKGKGKGKAVNDDAMDEDEEEEEEEEDDDDDDDDDEEEEDDDMEEVSPVPFYACDASETRFFSRYIFFTRFSYTQTSIAQDDHNEIDPSAILPPSRRTRGVKVDYTSKEALEKAGLDKAEGDDDEEE